MNMNYFYMDIIQIKGFYLYEKIQLARATRLIQKSSKRNDKSKKDLEKALGLMEKVQKNADDSQNITAQVVERAIEDYERSINDK